MASPTVLLFCLQPRHWAARRLASALAAGGWRVATCGPADGLLHAFPGADVRVALRSTGFAPLIRRGLERAAAAADPVLLVACDNNGCAFVSYLAERLDTLSPRLRRLLEVSLGDPATFPDRLLKHRTLAVARSLGIAVPPAVTALTAEEAVAFAAANGYPVIVKQSWNVGGGGLRVSADRAALAADHAGLARPPSIWRAVRRRWLRRGWRPSRGPVDVQAVVSGTPAMSCAVARDGRVVAVVSALARCLTRPNSQASVVALCRHAGIEAATASMIAAFGASGFLSFDFILEEATGRPVLLECNPRPIQIAHLAPRVGVDLVAALGHAFAGWPAPSPGPRDAEETVIHFPQEWLRDPRSSYFGTAFHDVPWDEPDLVRAILGDRPAPVPEGPAAAAGP
jgi:hypothetical protein